MYHLQRLLPCFSIDSNFTFQTQLVADGTAKKFPRTQHDKIPGPHTNLAITFILRSSTRQRLVGIHKFTLSSAHLSFAAFNVCTRLLEL
jgi:hypothetical protein